MTEQRRISLIAPGEKFRVVEWIPQKVGYPKPQLVDDFKYYEEAKAAATALPAASVFNNTGRAILQKFGDGKLIEPGQPVAVTTIAGLSNTGDQAKKKGRGRPRGKQQWRKKS